MSLSQNVHDSDEEVDFPLTQRPRQGSPVRDQAAAGVSRPSSPRRTFQFQHSEREMREMRELEGMRGPGNRDDRDEKNKKPHLKLQEFSGEEDWEEFISHFELCAELGRWTRKDQALALAATLRGAARTFYTGLSLRDRSGYDVLADRLRSRFGSDRQQSKWLSKLEGRKRAFDESISLLGDDLRQMGTRAYPDLSLRAQEAMALNQLYKSVTPELKCRCMDKDCKTIAEAVDVIERYESIMGKEEEKKVPVRAATGQPDQGNNMTNIVTELSRVTGALDQFDRRLNRFEWQVGPNNDRRNGVCYRCWTPGHFAWECP
jgi:hypothetical protein